MKKPITIDNYKNLTFSKIICEYYAGPGDEKNQYDILMPIDEDVYSSLSAEEIHKVEIERSSLYFNQLLRKFEELRNVDRERFIEFQLMNFGKLSQNWMFEVYDFLDEYENDINSIRPKMAEEFKEMIDVHLKRTKVSLSNLKWEASDTDFVVLTKALLRSESIKRTDGKKLYQKELDLAFEQFLNVEVKYKKDLLGSAKRMKIETNNFLTKLRQAWQAYIDDNL